MSDKITITTSDGRQFNYHVLRIMNGSLGGITTPMSLETRDNLFYEEHQEEVDYWMARTNLSKTEVIDRIRLSEQWPELSNPRRSRAIGRQD